MESKCYTFTTHLFQKELSKAQWVPNNESYDLTSVSYVLIGIHAFSLNPHKTFMMLVYHLHVLDREAEVLERIGGLPKVTQVRGKSSI